MKAKALNHMLIKCFPELIDEYHSTVDWQEGDDTGSHVVYGDVFVPLIVQSLNEDNQIELVRIFGFIEEVMSEGDDYANEVLMFSVLEQFIYDKKLLSKIDFFSGNNTRLIIEKMLGSGVR